jgi:hypothetical protein
MLNFVKVSLCFFYFLTSLINATSSENCVYDVKTQKTNSDSFTVMRTSDLTSFSKYIFWI